MGLAALLAAAGIGAAAWHYWPAPPDAGRLQGYVEGYVVYMAPEQGGRIERLAVDSGDQVKAGQFLFRIDPALARAQRDEAAARVQQAQAQLANLRAAQQRPEQIAVLQAQEQQAEAQLTLSTADLERQRALYERSISSKAQFDQAKATYDRDKAALATVQRQIEAGRTAARTAEIAAAEAAAGAAQAALDQAETRLAQTTVRAPADAQVQDVFFRAGEVVGDGQPVLSLLPPGNRRIRFYVPEPRLATVALGQVVGVTCDNCPGGLTARITFISREAEFTPPVIFSLEERAKLVFRVEATPVGDAVLPIGQPVTVALPEQPS